MPRVLVYIASQKCTKYMPQVLVQGSKDKIKHHKQRKCVWTFYLLVNFDQSRCGHLALFRCSSLKISAAQLKLYGCASRSHEFSLNQNCYHLGKLSSCSRFTPFSMLYPHLTDELCAPYRVTSNWYKKLLRAHLIAELCTFVPCDPELVQQKTPKKVSGHFIFRLIYIRGYVTRFGP